MDRPTNNDEEGIKLLAQLIVDAEFAAESLAVEEVPESVRESSQGEEGYGI